MTNIDLLKIICIISVILLHISSDNMFSLKYQHLIKSNFTILNLYNMLTRFCVPCFIMISGMFILNKEISIKEIFKKYILKIFIIFFLFSLLYALFESYSNNKDFISVFITGYYHLWYLYLIIGLYLITPILKKITNDKKIIIYYLVLSFIFTSVIPFIITFIKISSLKLALSYLNIHMVLGYTGYYLAGYYFSKYKVNTKIFYILGIIGFIFNYILFLIMFYDNKLYDTIFLQPGTVFQSIAVFLFFQNIKIKNNELITFISSTNLCVYLIHVIILELLLSIFPYIIYNNPLIFIPLFTLIIYIVCLLISITLKKIPLLKRLL